MGGNFLAELGQGMAAGMVQQNLLNQKQAARADETTASLLVKGLETDPESVSAFLQTKEGQKFGKRVFGKDGYGIVGALAQSGIQQAAFGKIQKQGAEELTARGAAQIQERAITPIGPLQSEAKPLSRAEATVQSLGQQTPLTVAAALGTPMGQLALQQVQQQESAHNAAIKADLEERKFRFDLAKKTNVIKEGVGPDGRPANINYQYNAVGEHVGTQYFGDRPEDKEALQTMQQMEAVKQQLSDPEFKGDKAVLQNRLAGLQRVYNFSLTRGQPSAAAVTPAFFTMPDPFDPQKTITGYGDPQTVRALMTSNMEAKTGPQQEVNRLWSQRAGSEQLITLVDDALKILPTAGPGTKRALYTLARDVTQQILPADVWKTAVGDKVDKMIAAGDELKASAYTLAVAQIKAEDPGVSAREMETRAAQRAQQLEGLLATPEGSMRALKRMKVDHTERIKKSNDRIDKIYELNQGAMQSIRALPSTKPPTTPAQSGMPEPGVATKAPNGKFVIVNPDGTGRMFDTEAEANAAALKAKK